MRINDPAYQAQCWLTSALNASRGNRESSETFRELNQSKSICIHRDLLQIPSVQATVEIVARLAETGQWYDRRLEAQAQEALNSLANLPKNS
jgi:hypothetical protein